MSNVEIIIVSDRSGSMANIQDDAEGGINALIESQKEQPGKANLTLVQFDTEYEILVDGINIQNYGKYTLKPRGGTALNDAVGIAMTTVKERLDKQDVSDRAPLVIFVVSTDGMENSSREYSGQRVADLIKEYKELGWQFQFLGADEVAFSNQIVGSFDKQRTVNTSKKNLRTGYNLIGEKFTNARTSYASGQSANSQAVSACLDFSDDEKDMLANDDQN